jgi:hypothetical protein
MRPGKSNPATTGGAPLFLLDKQRRTMAFGLGMSGMATTPWLVSLAPYYAGLPWPTHSLVSLLIQWIEDVFQKRTNPTDLPAFDAVAATIVWFDAPQNATQHHACHAACHAARRSSLVGGQRRLGFPVSLSNRGSVLVFRFPLNENAREDDAAAAKRKRRVKNQISHRRRGSKSNKQTSKPSPSRLSMS